MHNSRNMDHKHVQCIFENRKGNFRKIKDVPLRWEDLVGQIIN